MLPAAGVTGPDVPEDELELELEPDPEPMFGQR
jgi:hypothetical protein